MTTDTKLSEVMALADEYWRAGLAKKINSDVEQRALRSAVAGILDALEAAQAKELLALAELREALGDPEGRLMQAELVSRARNAQADARRYRWLRTHWFDISAMTDHGGHALNLRITNGWPGELIDNDRLDAAIDAALLSETQPSSNAIRPDDPSPGSGVKGEQP